MLALIVHRSRKRKYYGNQFSTQEGKPIGISASARKLAAAHSDEIPVNHSHRYRIIEFVTVFSMLSELLCCKSCHGAVKFEESGQRGLGWKLVVSCKCGANIVNSGPFINNGFEVNRRIVFAMRLLGVGMKGVNLFCSLMDLCKGLSKKAYDGILEHIHQAAMIYFQRSCAKAVEEEKKINEEHSRPLLQFKVSGDGSWKKRGFSSKIGVTTLIVYESGKIIDLVVKSSLCQACAVCPYKKESEEYAEWFANHADECTTNHEGSAGKMEVDAVIEMFNRSRDLHDAMYTTYIGDGDSKTFTAVLKENPYGEEYPVMKCECVGHVQKRMGTRLRNVKKKEKLGGKGKLTDGLIKKLSNYYGLAIKRHTNTVDDMKKAIMATFLHMCSTDENPQHHYCPTGITSWCKWQSSQATGQNYVHPPPLHADVQKHLLPIYEDLSRDDLLTRCLGGYTQNANESFNALVWRLAPKHLHCGPKTVEIAAYIAATVFNDGFTSVLKMMKCLELTIGSSANNYAQKIDEDRVERQNQRSESCTKEARLAKKMELAKQEEGEELLYGPGIAD